MTHTPGPWTALKPQEYSITGQTILVLTDDRYPTAFVPAWTDNPDTADEARANARLIAAAPDLLAALQDAMHVLEHTQVTPSAVARYERARAAITKATEPTT